MPIAVAVESSLSPASVSESLFEAGKRLADLLAEVENDSAGDSLPEFFRERIANIVESVRNHLVAKMARRRW
jgi:hypothetical protein